MGRSGFSKWAPTAIRLGIFTLLMFLSARIGLAWIVLPENLAGIWISNGIALAVLLLNRRKDWSPYLGALLIATTVAYLIQGGPWLPGLGYALVHTLGTAASAWIFTRIQRNEIGFDQLSDVFALLITASLGSAVFALLGAFISTLANHVPFWDAWWLWWNEDSASVMVLTPLLVTFWRGGKAYLRQDLHMWPEILLVTLVQGVISWFIFSSGNMVIGMITPHHYMLFPWLIWSCLRFKNTGATLSFFLVSVIAVASTLTGSGTFPLGGQTLSAHLELVYLFLSVSSVANLVMIAVLSTLKNTQKELRRSEKALRSALQVAHLGNWNWDIKNNRLEWSDEMFGLFGLDRSSVSGNLAEIYAQCILPDDREKARQFNRNLIVNKSVEPIDYRIAWPDGSIHIIWTKIGELLTDSGGQAVSLSGISQDITERKQAEEQLAFTQFAIDHAADAAYWMDHEGRFIYVNYEACRVLGYSNHELLQMTVMDIDPGLTPQLWQAQWQRRDSVVKAKNRRKDGTIFPVEVFSSYVDYGGILYDCSFSRDITLREAAEAALQASENRYRTLYENSPSSIWEEDFSQVKAIFDALRADGVNDFRAYFESHPAEVQRCASAVRIVDCNLKTIQFFGAKTKEEIIFELPHYFTEESYPAFREEMISLAHGRTTFECEVPVSHNKDKDLTLMIYLAVIPGYEETLSKVLVSFIDITERKLTESLLFKTLAENRTSLNFLQNVLDTSPAYICWKDRDLRFLGCNRAYASLVGLAAPEDIVGKTDWQMPWSADNTRLYQEANRRIMDNGQPEYHIMENILNASGDLLWLDTNMIPMRNYAGEVTGILLMIQDVSAQKIFQDQIQQLNAELEKRVEQRTAQLQASNQELESFSYSVSHDLRAPLRSINGFSQIIMEEYSDRLDETGRGYFKQILSASQRMGQLIENLLKLSKVTRAGLQLSQVDLCVLFREVVANLQKDSPGREVEVIMPEKLVVRADESLMRVALDNLVGNAWKFTGKSLDATIELGFMEKDRRKVFFVRDNGAGFDMAYVDKLFGTFQRLHSEKEFAGTGVGLALVQRIIRRHGGTIWAEGMVNHGAVFYFTLPE